MKNIAEKLKDARQRLGFSQEYVAKCFGIGQSLRKLSLGIERLQQKKFRNFANFIMFQQTIFLIRNLFNLNRLCLRADLKNSMKKISRKFKFLTPCRIHKRKDTYNRSSTMNQFLLTVNHKDQSHTSRHYRKSFQPVAVRCHKGF